MLLHTQPSPRHIPTDDDDISQETYNWNNETTTSGGYQRVEDWHEQQQNEKFALENLRREQERWSKTFEDLGGDGI